MLSLHGSKLFAHPKHSPKNFPDFAYIYIYIAYCIYEGLNICLIWKAMLHLQ